MPNDAPETTADLLALVRSGDDAAESRLVARFLPVLRRWAHGRLPPQARSLAETDDLVQNVLIRALAKVDQFESRGEGAFLAYLRTSLLNSVRDETRRAVNRLRHDDVDDVTTPTADPNPSELEKLVGREAVAAFEASLAKLPATQQEAVILRLEFGMSHQEVADAIGSSSADAARMLVTRALAIIAEDLDEYRPTE